MNAAAVIGMVITKVQQMESDPANASLVDFDKVLGVVRQLSRTVLMKELTEAEFALVKAADLIDAQGEDKRGGMWLGIALGKLQGALVKARSRRLTTRAVLKAAAKRGLSFVRQFRPGERVIINAPTSGYSIGRQPGATGTVIRYDEGMRRYVVEFPTSRGTDRAYFGEAELKPAAGINDDEKTRDKQRVLAIARLIAAVASQWRAGAPKKRSDLETVRKEMMMLTSKYRGDQRFSNAYGKLQGAYLMGAALTSEDLIRNLEEAAAILRGG